MKILLPSVKADSKKKCINKDLSGGMGTGTWVGNSWRARLFEFTKRSSVVLPEITIAYLAAIFKKAGWEVELTELKNLNDIKNLSADLVLIPSSIVDCDKELLFVKKIKEKGIPVGVYGTFATAVPEYFSAADFVIVGEPEAGALELLKSKELPKGIMKVAPVENLDELPFPDWSQFNIKKYSYFPALYKKPVVLILSSRGCPYSCAYYCPYTINSGRKWRARSLDNLIAEIKYLINNFGVKAIDFRDPIFTLDRQRTIDFCEKLSEKKIKIIWSCETRIDRLDRDLILEMYRAGLRHLNLGVESANENVLKKSSRLPIGADKQKEIIDFCHKLGISVAAFYIIGMESDNEETVLNTINYAKSLNTLVAQFTISTPYPGTQFFERIKMEGRLFDLNWTEFDAYSSVYCHENLSPEKLVLLKEKAFVSYYFRPAYFLRHVPKILMRKIAFYLCQAVKI